MLEAYGPFILTTASRALRRYITKSDDAWSVALIAFWEAVDHYREEQGGFEAYARLVIRRET
ncbi:MAG TPA: sigma factor, partial [Candidatus Limiplasma sp.]|nr:sigma factor [Candidatus Limiplasma sp.]